MTAPMILNVKKLDEEAVIPRYAKPGDAGLDLTAITKIVSFEDAVPVVTYGTGLSIEIPEGYVGLIYPRSSVYASGLVMANCTGVIDSGYRGEIKVKFYTDNKCVNYGIGDRVAQLIIMPYPQVILVQQESLKSSVRGDTGFGSTGA